MPVQYRLSDYIIKSVLINPAKTYAWSSIETYYPSSIVEYGDNYYSCISEHVGKQPDIETSYWMLYNEFQYEIDLIGQYCQDEIDNLYLNPAVYNPLKNYYNEMIALLTNPDSKLKDDNTLAYYILIDDTALLGFAFGFRLQMISAKSVMNVLTPPPFYPYTPLTINPFIQGSMIYGFNTKVLPFIPPIIPPVTAAPPLKNEIELLINAFNLFLIDAFTITP
jgi:hypothetical protein